MKHFYPVRHPPVPPAATRGETTPAVENDAAAACDRTAAGERPAPRAAGEKPTRRPPGGRTRK
jgi:hypothetical protein